VKALFFYGARYATKETSEEIARMLQEENFEKGAGSIVKFMRRID
jgi:hypothetical protein